MTATPLWSEWSSASSSQPVKSCQMMFRCVSPASRKPGHRHQRHRHQTSFRTKVIRPSRVPEKTEKISFCSCVRCLSWIGEAPLRDTSPKPAGFTLAAGQRRHVSGWTGHWLQTACRRLVHSAWRARVHESSYAMPAVRGGCNGCVQLMGEMPLPTGADVGTAKSGGGGERKEKTSVSLGRKTKGSESLGFAVVPLCCADKGAKRKEGELVRMVKKAKL